MPHRIKVLQGDITCQKANATLNAANNPLLGRGGAIHSAAGPALMEKCKRLGGCTTGDAKITRGYSLLVKLDIHTVGPIWRGGNNGEDETLALFYQSCLRLAKQHNISTIAFPSISTGAYGFPVERASIIATRVRRGKRAERSCLPGGKRSGGGTEILILSRCTDKSFYYLNSMPI